MCVHAYMHACVCVSSVCLCVCARIRTYTHTHIRAHTLAYAYNWCSVYVLYKYSIFCTRTHSMREHMHVVQQCAYKNTFCKTTYSCKRTFRTSAHYIQEQEKRVHTRAPILYKNAFCKSSFSFYTRTRSKENTFYTRTCFVLQHSPPTVFPAPPTPPPLPPSSLPAT